MLTGMLAVRNLVFAERNDLWIATDQNIAEIRRDPGHGAEVMEALQDVLAE
jgi:hypothetical protein